MVRNSITKTVTIYKDLARWIEENNVVVSTYLNAALYLLKDNNVHSRTRNVEAAKRDLLVAALRELGLNVSHEDIDEIKVGRKRLAVKVDKLTPGPVEVEID